MTTVTKTSPVLCLQHALKATPVSPPYGGIPASRVQPVPKPTWYDHLPAQGKALIEEVRQGRVNSLLLVWNGCVIALNHYPHGVPDADGRRVGFVARILEVPSAMNSRLAEAAPQAPAATPRRRPKFLSRVLLAATIVLGGGLVLGGISHAPPIAEWQRDGLTTRVAELEKRIGELEQKLPKEPTGK